MAIQKYSELIVWQKAMDTVALVYQLTKKLPTEEKYGLKSQIQRASVSVPANIAEGYGRTHRGDYLRFLSIAKGSLCEVETYLVLFTKLNFMTKEEIQESWDKVQEVGKMLTALIHSLSPTP